MIQEDVATYTKFNDCNNNQHTAGQDQMVLQIKHRVYTSKLQKSMMHEYDDNQFSPEWLATKLFCGQAAYICTSLSFESHDSNQTILPFMYLNNSGEWPLGRDKIILLEYNNVTNRGISGRVSPLSVFSETCQILRKPSVPEVANEILAQMPATKKRDRAIRERRVWKRFEWPSNKEVSRSQNVHSIVITS